MDGQHYLSVASGPGEIDGLLALDWPLVVEAKAHGLTAPGRRGAPRRVERVADNVVTKALQQTDRASNYILVEGGRNFSATQNGEATAKLPAQIVGVTEVIVTFERIDPFAMLGPKLVAQSHRPVWIVSIADFLMVADILDDPTSFHHYVRTRAASAVRGPVVYVEADALGAYLTDRLNLPTVPEDHRPDTLIMLGYSSDAINQYYTETELGHEQSKPTSGVPTEVLTAMALAMLDCNGLWPPATDQVMSASADAWRRWRKYRKRHRTGTFDLTPAIQLAKPAEPALAKNGDVMELGLPA